MDRLTRRDLLALAAAAMVRPGGPGDGAVGAAAMVRPGGPGDGAVGAAGQPPPSFSAFVPVVFRSRPGLRWRTAVSVRSPSGGRLRLERWPAALPSREDEVLEPRPDVALPVPPQVPPFPSISSYLFTGDAPFHVTAEVEDRTGERPSLPVPVLPLESLARPGDTLRVGPFAHDEREDGHFCFTFPRTARAWTPVHVDLRFRDPASGRTLRSLGQVLSGMPRLIERPWRVYALPPSQPFDLEVRWLGTYGRTPPRGLWVYGISRDLGSGASRFLPTTVRRGTA